MSEKTRKNASGRQGNHPRWRNGDDGGNFVSRHYGNYTATVIQAQLITNLEDLLRESQRHAVDAMRRGDLEAFAKHAQIRGATLELLAASRAGNGGRAVL